MRNTPRAREAVAQWIAMAPLRCDAGRPGKGAPEQACMQRLAMHPKWRASVDVVSARHFNTPAWFHSRLDTTSTRPQLEPQQQWSSSGGGGGGGGGATSMDELLAPFEAYEAARSAPWVPMVMPRVPGGGVGGHHGRCGAWPCGTTVQRTPGAGMLCLNDSTVFICHTPC